MSHRGPKAKIDYANALAMANAGYSLRAIAEKFPGSSHVAASRAIARAVRAGGVLKRPRKMYAEEFAGLTYRIWQAKQATMARPDDVAAKYELTAAVVAFEKAIL
jgi:hypothetical protein